MRTHKGQIAHAPKAQTPARIQASVLEQIAASHPDGYIIIVDRRSLVAECMTSCLTSMLGAKVTSFPNLESWISHASASPASLIVFCNADGLENAEEERERSLLSQIMGRIPTVILSDREDLDRILSAIEGGARGYIPTNMSLDVVVEAIRLVRAGGVFVPANSLLAARRASEETAAPKQGTRMFTVRQAAVVQALCKGKANKLIAHELNMRESTVKVHVRNIMKKLSAKNRTEVALMASGLPL